jgi:hypothetical protein
MGARAVTVIDGRQRYSATMPRILQERLSPLEDSMLHIDIPTIAEFRDLAQLRAGSCVSLYMPTSRLAEKAESNRTLLKDV